MPVILLPFFSRGPFGGNEPDNGEVAVEGPHAPKPHTWYAQVVVINERVMKVR